MTPFYSGSHKADWHEYNCNTCTRGYGGNPENWHCELERALDDAYMGDGTVSAEIGARLAIESGSIWRCPEHIPNPFVQIQPWAAPKRVPIPLWRKLRDCLVSAWKFWIPFWDRTDHDCYSGLRSPLLAWSTAWIIHHDRTEVAR
jgi:hypothetical protein